MPTPEQWKQFKEWRKKKLELFALEYELATGFKNGSISENGVVRGALPSDIPPETVEGCLDWLSKD